MKKWIYSVAVALVAALAFTACDDDNDDVVSVNMLDESVVSGDWKVTTIDTIIVDQNNKQRTVATVSPNDVSVRFSQGSFKAWNSDKTLAEGTYQFPSTKLKYCMYVTHAGVTDTLNYLKAEGNTLRLQRRPSASSVRINYTFNK